MAENDLKKWCDEHFAGNLRRVEPVTKEKEVKIDLVRNEETIKTCGFKAEDGKWCEEPAVVILNNTQNACAYHKQDAFGQIRGGGVYKELVGKIEKGITVDTGIKPSSQWVLTGETHIKNEVLFFNIDPLEKLVFIIILAHAFKKSDGTRNEAFISYDTIGKEANIHRSTAIKRITALEKRGWLKIKKNKKKDSLENQVNHYSIVPDKIHDDMPSVVV